MSYDENLATQLRANPGKYALTRPAVAYIEFQRSDGPFQLRLSEHVSEQTALEIEAFLREALTRDRERQEAEKREAYAQQVAMAQQMNPYVMADGLGRVRDGG